MYVGAPCVRRRRLSTLTRVDERYPIGRSAVVVVVLTLREEFCNLTQPNSSLRDEGSVFASLRAHRPNLRFYRHRCRLRRLESLDACIYEYLLASSAIMPLNDTP